MVKIQWLGRVFSAHRRHHISILWFCYALGINVALLRIYILIFSGLWVRVHYYDSANMIHIIQSDSQPFMGHRKWLAWWRWNHSSFNMYNSFSNIERSTLISSSAKLNEKKIKCSSIIAHSFELTLSQCCPKWTSYHLAIIYYACVH